MQSSLVAITVLCLLSVCNVTSGLKEGRKKGISRGEKKGEVQDRAGETRGIGDFRKSQVLLKLRTQDLVENGAERKQEVKEKKKNFIQRKGIKRRQTKWEDGGEKIPGRRTSEWKDGRGSERGSGDPWKEQKDVTLKWKEEEEAADEEDDRQIYEAVLTSMAEWQLNKLEKQLLSHKRVKRDEEMVCYKNLGCFRDDGPFDYFDFLPSPPEEINTKFLLFTRENSERPQFLEYDNRTSILKSHFNSSRSTKFIIPGFGSSCSRVWISEMTDAILNRDDVNLVCVDWKNGASLPNYVRAASNTRLVGRQVALLVEMLNGLTNSTLDQYHLIGFSLGAHISGFAGARLKGIRRISGLDPAGPLFESYPPSVRLDPTDAKFVDVIHTNADSLLLGGLGAFEPMGHIDHYPNGGKIQKGCANLFLGGMSDILWPTEGDGRYLCNHRRGYKYFTASVHPLCKFPSSVCGSFEEFQEGECFPCENCGNMGYYADQSSGRGKHFLITAENEPFCANQYKVVVEHSEKLLGDPVTTYGQLDINFIGDTGLNQTFQLTRRPDQAMKSGERTVGILVPHQGIGEIQSLQIKYTAHNGWFYSGFSRWAVDKVSIMDSYGNVKSFCYRGTTLVSEVTMFLNLLPGDCIPIDSFAPHVHSIWPTTEHDIAEDGHDDDNEIHLAVAIRPSTSATLGKPEFSGIETKKPMRVTENPMISVHYPSLGNDTVSVLTGMNTTSDKPDSSMVMLPILTRPDAHMSPEETWEAWRDAPPPNLDLPTVNATLEEVVHESTNFPQDFEDSLTTRKKVNSLKAQLAKPTLSMHGKYEGYTESYSHKPRPHRRPQDHVKFIRPPLNGAPNIDDIFEGNIRLHQNPFMSATEEITEKPMTEVELVKSLININFTDEMMDEVPTYTTNIERVPVNFGLHSSENKKYESANAKTDNPSRIFDYLDIDGNIAKDTLSLKDASLFGEFPNSPSSKTRNPSTTPHALLDFGSTYGPAVTVDLSYYFPDSHKGYPNVLLNRPLSHIMYSEDPLHKNVMQSSLNAKLHFGNLEGSVPGYNGQLLHNTVVDGEIPYKDRSRSLKFIDPISEKVSIQKHDGSKTARHIQEASENLKPNIESIPKFIMAKPPYPFVISHIRPVLPSVKLQPPAFRADFLQPQQRSPREWFKTNPQMVRYDSNSPLHRSATQYETTDSHVGASSKASFSSHRLLPPTQQPRRQSFKVIHTASSEAENKEDKQEKQEVKEIEVEHNIENEKQDTKKDSSHTKEEMASEPIREDGEVEDQPSYLLDTGQEYQTYSFTSIAGDSQSESETERKNTTSESVASRSGANRSQVNAKNHQRESPTFIQFLPPTFRSVPHLETYSIIEHPQSRNAYPHETTSQGSSQEGGPGNVGLPKRGRSLGHFVEGVVRFPEPVGRGAVFTPLLLPIKEGHQPRYIPLRQY